MVTYGIKSEPSKCENIVGRVYATDRNNLWQLARVVIVCIKPQPDNGAKPLTGVSRLRRLARFEILCVTLTVQIYHICVKRIYFFLEC